MDEGRQTTKDGRQMMDDGSNHRLSSVVRRLSSTERLDWLVAGLLLLLALLFVSPGLPPWGVAAPMDQLLAFTPWHTYYPDANPPFHGGDLLLQQLPWRHWMQQELAAGRFPLWASSPAGGMPLFAGISPGALHPLHLLWILMPVGAGLGVIMALKLWLAGLGMWLFLRALGLRPAAALVSALGFMFSAWLVDWLTWAHTSVYVLLPWMAWAVYAWCQGGKRPALFWLALLVGFGILGGHPETLFIIGMVITIWALLLLDFRDPRHLLRQALWLGVSMAVGFALGAIQLLPFLSIIELTHTVTQRPGSLAFARFHLDTRMMLDLVLPRSWGHPSEGVLMPSYIPTNFTEANGYAGLAALLGLPLTMVAATRRGVRLGIVLPWVVIGVLAWVVTFDDNLGTVIRSLPAFNRSDNARWVAIIGFAALVLSAFGWDWLVRSSEEWVARHRVERWPPGRPGGAAMALLAVGLGIMAVHAAGIPSQPVMPQEGPWLIVNDDYRFYWAIWSAGAALALLGAVGLWASAWRWRRAGLALACALVVLDLWRLVFTINGTAPADHYFPETSFLRQVKALVPPTERFLVEGDGMPTNTALVYGIRDWRTQDPMLTQRAHRAAVMLDPVMPKSIWTDYNMILQNIRLPIAPLLGVRYFIFPAGVNPNTPSLDDPTVPPFTRLAYKEGLGLWRAEGVPGFAYLSDNLYVASDEKTAAWWMEELDWRQTRAYPALVEGPAQEVASVKHDPAGSSPGKTEVLEYTPGHVKVRAEAVRPALLVVSESWYPGWRARLDGNPVGVLRANYLSQGVVVPTGTHTVELNYEPGAFKYGALVSGLGVVGLAGLGVWAWRRRKSGVDD